MGMLPTFSGEYRLFRAKTSASKSPHPNYARICNDCAMKKTLSEHEHDVVKLKLISAKETKMF